MKKVQVPDWLVCQGINWWLEEKDITLTELCRRVGYRNVPLIKKRLENLDALPTDFLSDCVDAFGLKAASRAKFEDTTDTLLDDECRELLTEPLRRKPSRHIYPQSKFWE